MTLIAPRRFSSRFRSVTKTNPASLAHQLTVWQKQAHESEELLRTTEAAERLQGRH